MKKHAFIYAFCIVLFWFFIGSAKAQAPTYKDLRGSWDTVTVLNNPHKGWYIHYYDNGLDHYGASLAPNDFLKDLKGLNHVYLRLAWSYLEPKEGVYNWQVIDSIINKWTAKGYKITFRISCKETDADQVFATPEWVKNAGAKGAFVGKNKNWEPDFGDPIFLKKLEQFHKVFGARYAGKPYLEYVDIGSIGDWGEGHTVFGSRKEVPFEVVKKHIDIYKRCYPKTLLMISDDFITSRNDQQHPDTKRILDYILEQGIAFRDDSVSVKYFADNYGFSTLRSQYLFEQTWRKLPGDLELEHYLSTLEYDTWKGGKPLAAAIEEAHATYVGFHGPPRQWLEENRRFADSITNRIGYWYFINGVKYPDQVNAGKELEISVSWLNRGVAPAYHKYDVYVQLMCGGKEIEVKATGSDNRNWMPDSVVTETYKVQVPANYPRGSATIGIRMESKTPAGTRKVALGLMWKNAKGYYTVGKTNIVSPGRQGKETVVLFGDSITEGAFDSIGYASLLLRNAGIRAKYEFIGEGMGGNRVTDLKRRMERDVLSYDPKTVVLFVGVNDCGWHEWHPKDPQVSLQQYEQTLDEMVRTFRSKGIRVVLCTPAIIGEDLNNRSKSDISLDDYAAACKRVATANQCAIADIRSSFLEYLRQHGTPSEGHGILTKDGVHPTAKGSALIAAAISDVL